jgi:V-type H+-transporting ATPase subunit a
VWGIFFGGRYIILLMGFFSMYTGLIYNDLFSRTMNIFGSSWGVNYTEDMIYGYYNEEGEFEEGMEHGMLIPNLHKPCDDDNTSAAYNLECGGHYRGDPYWFGIDPIWMLAENKIVYLNSYKMKLSIIIAVIHMTFGVFLNLWNYTYYFTTTVY